MSKKGNWSGKKSKNPTPLTYEEIVDIRRTQNLLDNELRKMLVSDGFGNLIIKKANASNL